MLHARSTLYDRLHEQIRAMPVIDCHEHMAGPHACPPYREPIASLICGYVFSDLQSAAFGVNDRDLARLQDEDVSTDAKWPLFEKLWCATEHTAYARVTKLLLKNVYGVDKLTRDALDRVAGQLASRGESSYARTLDEAGIRAMLVDVLGEWAQPEGIREFLAGKAKFPARFRPLVPLPELHSTNVTRLTVNRLESLVDRYITSLDEYTDAVFELLWRCVACGAIGLKDQSAYRRSLSHDLPTKAEAERQFNGILVDPLNTLGWPEGKPLNDYLFHQFMRFARDLDLPVQIHTGHIAGIRNRVDRANAAHLTSVLELHREVRFDLFHGNWPYMGDILFLGKNYPNVAIDCCWLHIIDPDYASELLERSVLTMPHTKIHGFGGDYHDVPEFVAAHLQMARANIAGALTRLVERGWLEEEEALSLAAAWLFNNPNRFFKLGFDEI